MKAFVLVLTSIFFAPVVLAQSREELPAEKIKILSWNIYMLPGICGYANNRRAEAIGNLLATSDYDIIVFQEAFSKSARNKISRLLQSAFPFQSGPPSEHSPFSLRINSGLWIVSRHPIVEVHSIVFNNRYGIDAMSKKGAIMTMVNVRSQLIQVVGTHLQNDGADWRRSQQCVELYERLLKKNEIVGVPQIICGDFNIDMHNSSETYQSMLNTIDARNGPLTGLQRFSYDRLSNDLQKGKNKHQDLIDYILVRSNQSTVICNGRNIKMFQQSWRSGHLDLSDHYSLEAEVILQRNGQPFTASLKAIED